MIRPFALVLAALVMFAVQPGSLRAEDDAVRVKTEIGHLLDKAAALEKEGYKKEAQELRERAKALTAKLQATVKDKPVVKKPIKDDDDDDDKPVKKPVKDGGDKPVVKKPVKDDDDDDDDDDKPVKKPIKDGGDKPVVKKPVKGDDDDDDDKPVKKPIKDGGDKPPVKVDKHEEFKKVAPPPAKLIPGFAPKEGAKFPPKAPGGGFAFKPLTAPGFPAKGHDVPPEVREAAGKIQHMQQAAAHLEQAGMKDAAHSIREQAEKVQAEVHRHLSELKAGAGKDAGPNREIGEAMRNMNAQLEEMRRQMDELRKQVRELSRDK